jgi:hypothetical protein
LTPCARSSSAKIDARSACVRTVSRDDVVALVERRSLFADTEDAPFGEREEETHRVLELWAAVGDERTGERR